MTEQIWQFLINMVGTSLIEQIAVLLGLINVTLIIRRSIWNYPFGLLMVVLYCKIFFDYALYSDSLLQIYFFAIQIYGLWNWLKHRDERGLVTVERASRKLAGISAILAIVGVALLGTVMMKLTDASYPYWDATIAVLSVIAQYLLSRRILESWVIWIIVDLLAISLFWIKGLHPTAVLYAVFLVLAVVGLRKWVTAWRQGKVTG